MGKLLSYTILFVTMLWACNEPIIAPPVDTVPKPFEPEILWRRQHGPEKFDQVAFRIELYENKLIAGYQTTRTSGYWIYDKNTGDVLHDISGINSFVLSPG